MAHLTFRHEKLRRLLLKAESRWKLDVRPLYDEETGPGFWIVGDQGVYFMHNGATTKAKTQAVVYAEECNPETQPFESWWSTKALTFGSDDGVDFISKEEMEKIVASGLNLRIEFTPDEMRFSLV